MKNYKVLVHIVYTKRDTYGNVYKTARIINPKTSKGFTVTTPDESNIRGILKSIFPDKNFYITNECTGSARISSLPDYIYLNECRKDDAWLTELRKIGYRIPKVK